MGLWKHRIELRVEGTLGLGNIGLTEHRAVGISGSGIIELIGLRSYQADGNQAEGTSAGSHICNLV